MVIHPSSLPSHYRHPSQPPSQSIPSSFPSPPFVALPPPPPPTLLSLPILRLPSAAPPSPPPTPPTPPFSSFLYRLLPLSPPPPPTPLPTSSSSPCKSPLSPLPSSFPFLSPSPLRHPSPLHHRQPLLPAPTSSTPPSSTPLPLQHRLLLPIPPSLLLPSLNLHLFTFPSPYCRPTPHLAPMAAVTLNRSSTHPMAIIPSIAVPFFS